MKPCPNNKHWWMCEPPNGETSMAHCKFCPAIKEFRNSMPAKGFTTVAYTAYSNREIFMGKHQTFHQMIGG